MDLPEDAADATSPAEPQVGELRRTLYALALPVLGEYSLTYCVGLFDVFLSGRFGEEATKAVGLAAYVTWLVAMLLGLVSTGTAALVSRSWGAGDRPTASRVLNRSLAFAGVLSGMLAVGVALGAPFLVRLLAMNPTGEAVSIRYLQLESIGYLFVGVTLAGSAALRGSGDTRTPMVILGSVNVINMAASSSLVFGVGTVESWGVDGIVFGTVFARGCGAALMLLALARRTDGLALRFSEFRLWDATVRRILRIGFPALGESLTMWSGQFLFLMIIGRLKSDAALAAHMIGVRVEDIAYLPALAFGAASGTMIGQALGRGDPATARRVAHLGALQGGMCAAAVGALFYVFAGPIFRMMNDAPEVAAVGVPAFRVLALFQMPQAMGLVYIYSLRGAGDTRTPMLITTLCVYGIRVPLAWLGGLVLDGGLLGAWAGMFADVTMRSLLAFLWYSTGKWVRTEV